MSGQIINVLPKNTYNITSAALAASQIISFPVAVNVNVSRYRDLILVGRVHSFTGASGASVTFEAFNSAPTLDDPATVFRDGTALVGKTVSWSASFTPAVVFGYATPVNAGSASAGFVDVFVSIKQASAAANLAVSVSCDLLLKS